MPKPIFLGKSFGISMTPLINQGDKLYIIKVNPNELKAGDVIVFNDKTHLISHRVIKNKDGIISTKGDNIPFFDKPLKHNQVLGKVVRIKGVYGTINLTSTKATIINSYFLFRSLITFLIPRFFFRLLSMIFRGRRMLTKLLKENT